MLLGYRQAEHAHGAHLGNDIERDVLIFEMPLVRVRDHLFDGELAHFLAHGGKRLVHAGIAEGRRTRLVSDERGNAHLHIIGETVLDKLGHSRPGEKARDLGCGNAELPRAHDLALAHGNAAADLREVLAEGRTDQQALHLTCAAVGFETLRPAEHLPERLDVGREPSEAVQCMLRAVAAPRRRRLRADRTPRELQEPLRGRKRA